MNPRMPERLNNYSKLPMCLSSPTTKILSSMRKMHGPTKGKRGEEEPCAYFNLNYPVGNDLSAVVAL